MMGRFRPQHWDHAILALPNLETMETIFVRPAPTPDPVDTPHTKQNRDSSSYYLAPTSKSEDYSGTALATSPS